MAAKKKTKKAKNYKVDYSPTPGYLLIKPLEAEQKTQAGIYLPDSATEKPQIGVIIEAGAEEITDSGTKRKAPAKAGEKIIYKKWGGNEVKVGTEEYLFIRFEDVLAVEK